MKLQGIKLVVGLGNPGKQYAQTYHNAGALFIDYLKSDPKLQIHPNLQILKSAAYMNESGRFVAKIAKKHHLKSEEILTVHDDSDIKLCDYKLSFGRGSAGHNGVESVIKALGTKNFWRLRIGIRPLEEKSKKALEFVLKKISKKDLEILNQVFTKASLNLKI